MIRHNIPEDLQILPQWVVSGPNKIPLHPRTGGAASVTDPKTWGTFLEAISSSYKHIGFVLTPDDPFTIIDLDNKLERPLNTEQIKLHENVINIFRDTYIEFSTSGRGFHIICRGKVPAGIHSHDGVEIYSEGRYMICTGNVYPYSTPSPIIDCQILLDRLYDELKSAQAVSTSKDAVDFIDRQEEMSDEDIMAMGYRAENGAKFKDLVDGNWAQMGYPSQSEADFALLSIIAYYSKNNDQVKRVFRLTKLGIRPKAQRDDYLNRCIAKIREVNALPAVDLSQIVKIAETLATVKDAKGVVQVPPAGEKVNGGAFSNASVSFPLGLVGEIAQYFYESSYRPVKEIALAASICGMAGVCGRSYNISGTGLNQYLLVLGKTGIGKEETHRALSRLFHYVRPEVPMIEDFRGPREFASGQALGKIFAEQPSFFSLQGEFGLTLQQICDPHANGALKMLKKVLLDLYSKSGAEDFYDGWRYSNKDNNVAGVQSPSLTILGESNPESFFASLDTSHIQEGLIPRFMFFEVSTRRPEPNKNAGFPPPKQLIEKFKDLAIISLAARNNKTTHVVHFEKEALEMADEFNAEADNLINAEPGVVEVELWNRAHLKALKLAGLVAVGQDKDNPIVSTLTMDWAINVVRKDMSIVTTRFNTGDIGLGDGKRINELKRFITMYLTESWNKIKGYDVDEQMYKDKVIPQAYLQRRTSNNVAYKTHPQGATQALKLAISELTDHGIIQLIPAHIVKQKYGSTAKVYAVVRLWK